ncbi:MAG: hypothetical protein QG585_554 [Patescibacteria group bacterium]|jgi:hypothetical protein|nr:hypothetical protein [Patescibacteria group bacterium]
MKIVNKKNIIILFSLFFIMFSFEITRAYVPLAPIEGYVTEGTVSAGLEAYIANMYRLGVGIATLLAVLMVIWGGVEYMTTDAWGHKEEGKERIQSALFGLMLALGSYVIIATIDKSILDVDFDMLTAKERLSAEDQFTLSVPNAIDDVLDDPNFEERDLYELEQPNNGGIPGESSAGYKVDIPSGINVASKGKQIDVAIASRLQDLQNNLSANGITWAVTEAYPPSRDHKAACHQTGTCIDANFRGVENSVENVKKFISSAQTSGLRAVYEVKTKADYDRLIAGGIPPSSVKNLGKWISAPHFSVYSN